MENTFFPLLSEEQKSQLLDILGEDGSNLCDLYGAVAYLEAIMRERRRQDIKECSDCIAGLRINNKLCWRHE